ncbi:MAG: RluA family pseudouridine synthase [Myxococcota bacterium]
MVTPSTSPQPTIHELTVPAEVHAPRLDRFVAGALPQLSRARVQKLLEDGLVSVDGCAAKPSQKLRAGQRIVVTEPPPAPAEALPQDIPIHVLFEDEHLLVINKPPGMVVHPGAGTPDGTLVNALLFHVEDLPPVGGELRPGIVHRLDKDTSGVLVVAKGDAALQALQGEFKDRRAEKRYLALCRGAPRPAQGTWETPFGRHPTARVKFTSRKGDRVAITDYRVLASNHGCALVELTLHTGRTHQIRVHLSEHGHPILGDDLYGGKKAAELPVPGARAERQMLHAAMLSLAHPKTGRAMRWIAPPPADFMEVARVLGLHDVVEGWVAELQGPPGKRARQKK